MRASILKLYHPTPIWLKHFTVLFCDALRSELCMLCLRLRIQERICHSNLSWPKGSRPVGIWTCSKSTSTLWGCFHYPDLHCIRVRLQHATGMWWDAFFIFSLHFFVPFADAGGTGSHRRVERQGLELEKSTSYWLIGSYWLLNHIKSSINQVLAVDSFVLLYFNHIGDSFESKQAAFHGFLAGHEFGPHVLVSWTQLWWLSRWVAEFQHVSKQHTCYTILIYSWVIWVEPRSYTQKLCPEVL